MPICSNCKENKSRKGFSTSQLKKIKNIRKCKECLSSVQTFPLHSPPERKHPTSSEKSLLSNSNNESDYDSNDDAGYDSSYEPGYNKNVVEEQLKKEEGAFAVLNGKKKFLEEEIQTLIEQSKKLINLPETKEKTVPFFDKEAHYKAVIEEKKRKHRAKARCEVYEVSSGNFEILYLPKRIEEVKEENNEIRLKNRSISNTNMDITKKREAIDKKVKRLLKEKEIYDNYSKEAEKNIRYFKYAIKNRLDVTPENLIERCNVHRNEYIAKKAYSRWASRSLESWEEYEEAPGYSKCYKDYRKCNNDMHYVDDKYYRAECECGISTWELKDTPGSNFDISDTVADGEGSGYSYFGASI